MLLGKAEVVVIERARTAVIDAVSPILDAISRPVGTINAMILEVRDLTVLRTTNAALKEQNARLLRWQSAANRLEAENLALRELLKFVPDPRQGFIAARVVGDQGGAFVRSIVVNAGKREGVRRGQAAVTNAGLAGRVAQAGLRAARILLLTDLNSRIPIIVGPTRARAVLVGDNMDEPKLLYLGPRVAVQPGERVVTSGEGGVLPPGLPIGVVVSTGDEAVRVAPFVDLDRLEYIRIIDYQMPGLLTASDEG